MSNKLDEDIRYQTLEIKFIEDRDEYCAVFKRSREKKYSDMVSVLNLEMVEILIDSAERNELKDEVKFLKYVKSKLEQHTRKASI